MYDVHKMLPFLTPCLYSTTKNILFVRKFGVFLDPPLPPSVWTSYISIRGKGFKLQGARVIYLA